MLKVFLFHWVFFLLVGWGLFLFLVLFEMCIMYIKSNYEVTTVEDYFLHRQKSSGKKKLASITFDDGFKDNLEYAAPVLKKYYCPASFYIVTDCIDKNIITWTHIYNNYFLSTNKMSLTIQSSHLRTEYNKTHTFASKQERINFGNRFFNELKNLPVDEIKKVVAQIESQFNDVAEPVVYMINWAEVNQLKNDGHVIGSHTKTHPFLSTINVTDTIDELKGSANRIAEMIGSYPISISYPVADFNA